MEERTLELLIVSARSIEDVNHITKLKPYVVVSLAGEVTSEQKYKTPVDPNGRKDPNWNFMMKFTINEITGRLYRQHLVFSLRTKRALGDRDIGNFTVPINELLSSGEDTLMKYATYQVRNPSGKPFGVLNFSYRFSHKIGDHFAKSPAAAAHGGPHHNFHPEVYPPPPKPFPPLSSSGPYGVYPPRASYF